MNSNCKLLSPYISGFGYKNVKLYKNGVRTSLLVHVLVALHFLEVPYEWDVVNHKNGKKLDCNYRNLEFATYSENLKHAWGTGLRRRIKCSELKCL